MTGETTARRQEDDEYLIWHRATGNRVALCFGVGTLSFLGLLKLHENLLSG